jgi:hypothetical protein
MTRRPLVSMDDPWRTGYVYFIRDIETRLIKIGFSRIPDYRIRQIRLAVGHPVELAAMLPGSRDLERRLHLDLRDTNDHREWFVRSPRLLAYIQAAQDRFPLGVGSSVLALKASDAPWLLMGCD